MTRVKLMLPIMCLLILGACSKSIQNEDIKTDLDLSPSTLPSTFTSGLLLYLPFNGSLADSSGYGNNGIGVGNIGYGKNRYLIANKSLRLDGNSRVEIPVGANMDNLSQFTIYLEFLPDSSNAMSILSRTIFNTTSNQKQVFNLMSNFNGGSVRYRMKKAGNCDNTNSATAFGTEVLGLGSPSIKTWNYVAVTYDGATIKMYMNGVLVGSGKEAGATLCSGAPFQIGSWVQAGPLYFKGNIDEVRVYDHVLSINDITKITQLKK